MKRLVLGAALAAACAGSSMAQNVSGTFSATLSGFQPTPSYSQLSASTASSQVALPSGTSIIVYNTGANDAYVTLGGPTVVATTSGDVVKAGGWMAFAVGANGFLAAITASGTTGLNISGGLGLPTGTAGTSGGGGGGGTVNQGNAGSASSAWFVQPGAGATFPVSAASLPLPAGAATAANQPALDADGGALAHVTNFPSTQAVSWSGQSVGVSSLPSLPGGSNTIGAVTQASAPWSVSWSGQSVGVSSLPPLPAGSNTIGAVTQSSGPWTVSWSGQSVGVSSLPPLPAGSNTIGAVTQSSGPWTVSWSGQNVGVSSLPPLPAGSNTIGAVTQSSGPWTVSWSGQNVGVSSLPSLPAGSNTVGGVTLPPQVSGGWTPLMLANLSTAQVVKASAGQVVRVQCDNISGSSAAYIQLLNVASSPSLGSNQIGYVPLASGGTGGFTLSVVGVQFSSGISIGAATTASGSTAASPAVNCEVDYN